MICLDGVVREVCRHNYVEEIHLCEIDQRVTKISIQHFANVSCSLPNDTNLNKRVQVHFMVKSF